MNRDTAHIMRELRYLRVGPSPEDKPDGLGTVSFVVHCEGDSWQVLSRAKSVLEQIDETVVRGWPCDSEWFRILPPWFVAQCVKEMSQSEAEAELARRKQSAANGELSNADDRWTLLNWIYWFQPENRHWFWWDAEERDSNTIVIAVLVNNWPFPWGSLSWLFRAAGANSVLAKE